MGLCHCTDLPVISVLAQEFGENFVFNKAGTVIEITLVVVTILKSWRKVMNLRFWSNEDY